MRKIIFSLQVQNLRRNCCDETGDKLNVEKEEKMAKMAKYLGGCIEVVEHDGRRPGMHPKEETKSFNR